MKSYQTLVLNADYRPLTIISWQRAICLVLEERVDQIDFFKNEKVRDGRGRSYPIPAVIVMRKYVRRDFRHAPFCKKNILIRDDMKCQYCGDALNPSNITVDHVIPRSKWKGSSSPTCWENIVACCVSCNRRKADKSCSEAKMFPLNKPTRPAYGELFLGVNPWKSRIPEEWMPYLSNLPIMRSLKNEQGSKAV